MPASRNMVRGLAVPVVVQRFVAQAPEQQAGEHDAERRGEQELAQQPWRHRRAGIGAGRDLTGLAMRLTKILPVAAGIGGGSADAAAALRLMVSLSTQAIPRAELSDMAAILGADVPACLVSTPLLAHGVGELLTPLPEFPALHIVLVNPMIPLPTADVFRRLRAHDNYPLPELPSPLTRPAQLGLWLAETRNDLQPPAVKLVPIIGDIVAHLAETQGCMLARMSGSGATVFGLFGSSGQAHQAAQVMRAANPDHWVAAAPLIIP